MLSPKALRRMYMVLWVFECIPLYSVLTAALFGENAAVLWGFSLLSLLLLWIMPPKGRIKRSLWALLSVLVMALASVWLPGVKERPLGFLLPMTCLIGLLSAVMYKRFDEAPQGFRLFALIAYLLLFTLSRLPGIPAVFAMAEMLQRGSLAIYLAVLFLVMNQEALQGNGLYGAIPRSVGRPNFILSIGFSLAIFLSGAWARLSEWLGMLWEAVKALLSRIQFGVETAVTSVPQEAPEMLQEFALEMQETEPNPFLLALEKLLLKIAPFVAVFLICLLLFLMFRKLVRFAKSWTRDRMEALEGAEIGDFVDEVEDVREKRERAGMRRRFARDKARLSDPRQRIRAGYKSFIAKDRAWDAAMTARETLSDADSASLYERARYSSHPLTEDDADRFQEALEEKKEADAAMKGVR
ncbi:MAG: DUF4129 domain-containing protein [Clostridia bacterium]|nr:DUF4129 domain-containing protein [Clostridia bacterium]